MLVTAAVAVAAPETGLRFELRSQPVAVRDLDWMRSRVPARDVRVFEPYEEHEVVFEAIALAPLLDAVYGDRWRSEEELLFTCSDGYQPTLPVSRVLQHEALIAFARREAPAFEISKMESGRKQQISLAPFYLVWNNLEDAQLRSDGDFGWPYQVVGIDLIRTADRFPNMVPPSDASPQVRAGYETFRLQCSRCHAIGGDGGTIGPDLNGASRPIETRDHDWLRRWIDDPSSVLPTSRMPRLNVDTPDRARVIDEILAYLEAISRAHPTAPPAAAEAN